MANIIQFPVKKEEKVFIRELDKNLFQNELASHLEKGLEVVSLGVQYKKTNFGGVCVYTAQVI